jgi:hypothetical protein
MSREWGTDPAMAGSVASSMAWLKGDWHSGVPTIRATKAQYQVGEASPKYHIQ